MGGVTAEHYLMVRRHFFELLGGKCSSCDFSEFEKIHFHHKTGAHIVNGEKGTGRGRDIRMWNLFSAYFNNDLELKCPECHKESPPEKQEKFKGV